MTVKEFKEMIICNEPAFMYDGAVYGICHPSGTFYVRAEGHPEYDELSFSDVDDLLDNWIIDGNPFRDILPDTVWEW